MQVWRLENFVMTSSFTIAGKEARNAALPNSMLESRLPLKMSPKRLYMGYFPQCSQIFANLVKKKLGLAHAKCVFS